MALKFLMVKKTGQLIYLLLMPENISVFDMWNAASDPANVFFTRPFNQVLLPRCHKDKTRFSREVYA